jgi:hypothetical protein
MKFCCTDFRWRYTTSNGMGLNIRVAKLHDSLNSRGFFITEGYQQNDTDVKSARIKFCPFCGTDLNKFYKQNQALENAKVEDFLK